MRAEQIFTREKVSREDKRLEKKEKEEYNIHSHHNLSGLKDRKENFPKENIVDKENRYNSSEAEDLVGGQEYSKEFEDQRRVGGKFIDVEDVPDQSWKNDKDGISEEEELNEIENKTEQTIKGVENLEEDKDVYDFAPILSKIYETLKQEKSGKNKWQKRKKFDQLFNKINVFLNEYQNILSKNIGGRKEYSIIHKTFRRIIGDLAYSGSKIYILPKFVKIRNGKAPKTAEKVVSLENVKAQNKNNNKSSGHQNNKRYNGSKSRHIIDGRNFRAYNPQTGKKEKILTE